MAKYRKLKDLCDLLVTIRKYHLQVESELEEKASRLAARLAETREETTPEQAPLLRQRADGKISDAELREKDPRAYETLRRCKPSAVERTYGEWIASKLREAGDAITFHNLQSPWEYATSEVLARLDGDFSKGDLAEYIAHVHLAIVSRTTPLETELTRLDRAGFAGVLLEKIWEKFPEDCRKMQLPTRDDLEGHRYVMVPRNGAWYIGFEGEEAQITERCVGLDRIAMLLERPGAEICATELTGRLPVETSQTIDRAYDEEAENQLKQRLQEIKREIAEVESKGNEGRIHELKRESEELTRYLARDTDIYGRPRRIGRTEMEKARLAVRQSILRGYKLLQQKGMPRFLEHLKASIRMGQRYKYNPDRPIQWHIRRHEP